MAFGFFRRHQKMVMIIMVVLMVSFLITLQGFQQFVTKDRNELPLGKTQAGDILIGDSLTAQSDIGLLEVVMGNFPQAPTNEAFTALVRVNQEQRQDPYLAYALLLAEARAAKVRVSDVDIDSFLASAGVVESLYQQLLDIAQSRMRLTESDVRAAIGRWLTIHKMFTLALVETPPSEEEIRYLCRDFYEKVNLRILRFSAERFLDEVPKTVDPNQVKAQFDALRNVPPDQVPDENATGIGYRQPDRVKILYMYFPRAAIERAVRPSDEEVRKYYDAHEAELLRPAHPASIPATASAPSTTSAAATASAPSTASAPATQSQPATAAAPAPAPEANVPMVRMSRSEARPMILQTLRTEAVPARMEDLLTRVRSLLAEYPAAKVTDVSPYEWVRNRMMMPAEAQAALQTRITVSIEGRRLDEAIEWLAKKAGLAAIAFPWGQAGDKSIDPGILVSVSGKEITLEEALQQVGQSAKWLPIEWGMCTGFDKVLFPTGGEGGADFFPVVVRQTPLLDVPAMMKDDILANTVTSPPMRANVAGIAFNSQPLAPQFPDALKVGVDGPAMNVGGPKPGGLLWRIVEAVPGHAPEQLTEDIRRQVEKDIRTRQALDLAYQRAARIDTVGGFEAADANGEANAIDTGFFARRTGSLGWSVPPALGLPNSPAVRKAFVDAAFALAPGEIEPAPIGRIRMPCIREVLVMRRTGYQPLTQEDYETLYRQQVLYRLYVGGQQYAGVLQQSYLIWFDLRAVAQRVGWQPAGGARGGSGPTEE